MKKLYIPLFLIVLITSLVFAEPVSAKKPACRPAPGWVRSYHPRRYALNRWCRPDWYTPPVIVPVQDDTTINTTGTGLSETIYIPPLLQEYNTKIKVNGIRLHAQ